MSLLKADTKKITEKIKTMGAASWTMMFGEKTDKYEPLKQIKNVQTGNDAVNKPSHYTGGEIECIDAIKEATKDLQGIEAVCTANAIKYLWRWKKKNGIEDLKKSKWYLEKLIKELESK